MAKRALYVDNMASVIAVGMWVRLWFKNKQHAIALLPYVLLEALCVYALEQLETVDTDHVWVTDTTVSVGDITIGLPLYSSSSGTRSEECPVLATLIVTRYVVPALCVLPLWIAYWRRETRLDRLWFWWLLLFSGGIFFVMRNQCAQRVASEWGSDRLHWTHYGNVYRQRSVSLRAGNEHTQLAHGPPLVALTTLFPSSSPSPSSASLSKASYAWFFGRSTGEGGGGGGGEQEWVDGDGGYYVGWKVSHAIVARLQHTGPLAVLFIIYVVLLFRPYFYTEGNLKRWADENPLLATIAVVQALLLVYDFGYIVRIFEFNLYATLLYASSFRPSLPNPDTSFEFSALESAKTQFRNHLSSLF